MTPALPEEFLASVKELLKEAGMPAFLASYESSPRRAMQLVKCSKEAFEGWEPLPESAGFFLPEGYQPAHCPIHIAGGYYVQEPSAMQVVNLLGDRKFSRILDLCAAPGGKSIQLASHLNPDGLLFVNEPVPSRARTLRDNLNRAGILDRVILSARPDELQRDFSRFFELILCDVPCSGEGMFRKNPETIREWSREHVLSCANRQQEILKSATSMLIPGGFLLYSTCTFNQKENEENLQFLVSDLGLDVRESRRLWPHEDAGEGHFMALLKRPGEFESLGFLRDSQKTPSQIPEAFGEWLSQKGSLKLHKGEFLLCTFPGRKIPRYVFEEAMVIGEEKPKIGFLPSHELAMALPPKICQQRKARDLPEILKFLSGEVLDECEEGLNLVSWQGLGMGWQLVRSGKGRNLVPKSIRAYVPRV